MGHARQEKNRFVFMDQKISGGTGIILKGMGTGRQPRQFFQRKSQLFRGVFTAGPDLIQNIWIKGGKIVLDDVNFAVTIPYHKKTKEINFYSEQDKLIGKAIIKEKSESYLKFGIIGMIAVVTVLLIIIIIRKNNG